MKQLLCLLLSCVLALPLGAVLVPVGQWVPLPSNVRYITKGASASTISGTIGAAPAGTTIYVMPDSYYIPEHTGSLLAPGVSFDFAAGARIRIGETGTESVFADNSATTNFIRGMGWIDFTNDFGYLIHLNKSASKVVAEFAHLNLYNTTPTVPTIFFENGRLDLTVHGGITNTSYDCLVTAGVSSGSASGKLRLKANHLWAGQTGVEVGNFDTFDGCILDIENLYCSEVYIGENCYFKIKQIQLHTAGGAGAITTTGHGTATNITIEAGVIDGTSYNGSPFVKPQKNLRLVGAKLIGTGGIAPVGLQSNMTFVNCEIVAGPTALYSVTNMTAAIQTIKTVGPLYVNAPIGPNILVDGEVIGPPLTNQYVGTNVFINVAGMSQQVLDATNSMLLVWTNATAFSGASGSLLIVNNKATNMNIAHSTANVRYMGGASNTVSSGKSLAIAWETVNTNLFLSFAPQTN